ncbi:MAG: hypothetical protein GX616_11255 [Planctomycetes bacterium]|nr:hypothetical protein [Planctomycetota bacterium]
MTIEQLNEVYRARPFKPFALELADGNWVEVPRPEFLMPSRTGRTVAVALENDAIKIIDLLLVTAIHISNGSPQPPGRN